MPEESSEEETVTVHVWSGPSWASADELVEENEPDEYELPVVDPYNPHLVSESDSESLATDIEHHGTYAFDIPDSDRPAELNVCTNDSYHDPDDWDTPIERGLSFVEGRDGPPFKCEMWGRIMMYVSPLDA